MITASTLRGIELFSRLPTEDRARIASRMHHRDLAKGEFAVHCGDESGDVYFIVSGRLRATLYSDNGKQVSFQDLGPGEMFGELAAVDGLTRATDVVALAPSTLGVLHREGFRATCRELPDVAEHAMRRLAGLVRMLLERVFEFSTLGVNNRIHGELLRLARDHVVVANTVTIPSPPTHEELANRLSTHREAVTRELKRLESEGLITWQRKVHRINDVAQLIELVHSAHRVKQETDSDERA